MGNILVYVVLAFSAGAIFGTGYGQSIANESLATSWRATWSLLSDTCQREVESASRSETHEQPEREQEHRR